MRARVDVLKIILKNYNYSAYTSAGAQIEKTFISKTLKQKQPLILKMQTKLAHHAILFNAGISLQRDSQN